MKNGFIRVGAAAPCVSPLNLYSNLDEVKKIIRNAHEMGVSILAFPELTLTTALCGNLFLQNQLLEEYMNGVCALAKATKDADIISVVGMPIAFGGGVYNCMAVLFSGEILGIVPKREADRNKVFCGYGGEKTFIDTPLGSVPFGAELVFSPEGLPALNFAVLFGDELLSAKDYGSALAIGGVNLIISPTAVSASAGGYGSLRGDIFAESKRLCSAVLSVNLTNGESGNDYLFLPKRVIAECGENAENKTFSSKDSVIYGEIDLEKITAIRRAKGGFGYCSDSIRVKLAAKETEISRYIDQKPYMPTDKAALLRVCEIQSRALAGRMLRAHSERLVLGVSGGLDSTLALLVAVMACDVAGIDRKNTVSVTMPGFGTTKRTKGNAELLTEALGAELVVVDIKDSVNLHLREIGYPEGDFGVTFENAQARERTQVLMDIANHRGGIVVGTGDLSELALGFATYNGDQMSMYGVNAGVPKTLMRSIITAIAEEWSAAGKDDVSRILFDILATPISPELLPPDENDTVLQCTEEIVGPYILHDFFLYYFLTYGFSPRKILKLAEVAFKGEYTKDEIKNTLKVFVRRFFVNQFKRTCMPDGPSVCGLSLSPRGIWNMPSDGTGKIWLDSLDD